MPLKRPRTASDVAEEYSILKRTKITTMSPASLAQPSIFKATQNDITGKVLDDRPYTNTKVAPISLLYKPFGEFEDIFTSGRPPNDIPVDLFTMETNVDKLIATMSLYYSGEPERRDAGIHILQLIFNFEIRPGGFENIWTSGHSHVNGLITTIAEFKNGIDNIHTFPNIQCAGYVARSHIAWNNVANLCGRYRIPALGMSFIGESQTFQELTLIVMVR